MGAEQESAEIVALRALGWLSGREDMLAMFLAASGTDLEDLRTRATEAVLLIAVLDFIMSEDGWVIAFCDEMGLPYESIDRARQNLPGGARIHWT